VKNVICCALPGCRGVLDARWSPEFCRSSCCGIRRIGSKTKPAGPPISNSGCLSHIPVSGSGLQLFCSHSHVLAKKRACLWLSYPISKESISDFSAADYKILAYQRCAALYISPLKKYDK